MQGATADGFASCFGWKAPSSASDSAWGTCVLMVMPTRAKMPAVSISRLPRRMWHDSIILMKHRWITALACAFVSTGAVCGQNESPIPPPPLVNGVAVERNLATLESLAASLAEAIEERDTLVAEAERADISEDRRMEILARAEHARERIRQLRGGFRDIIGGVEAADFETAEETETTIQDQLTEFIKPILSALQEPTSRLREMEDMRNARDVWSARRDSSDRVIARIAAIDEANRAGDNNERVAAELQAARRQWEARRSEAAGQIEVLTLQIEDRERSTPSFWQAVTAMIGDFVKSRGLNLLLALVAAVIAFMLTRRIYAWFRHISPVHHKKGGTLLGRASDLIALSTAIFVAITCVLIVFFARGDWLLLTISLILLVGILWAGKTALPPYVEQIRMLLNLGAVREDERIIYRGLPWRVESLGFYTYFQNPALHGGRMRVPLRDVMGMISRKARSDEPWFPCRQGDWVVLADNTHGQVVHQTPEQVVMKRRGGELKTYQTKEFLELAPENLAPGFRVRSIFGIDYAHQAICTTEVPAVFREAVHAALVTEFGADAVRAVVVEFNEAGSSSLDCLVKADLTHVAAPRYRYIPRLMQSTCVDVCNERGWRIPFTQVTLHRAGARH